MNSIRSWKKDFEDDFNVIVKKYFRYHFNGILRQAKYEWHHFNYKIS